MQIYLIRGLNPEYVYKEFSKFSNKKTSNTIKKWAKDLDSSPKERNRWQIGT